MNFSHIYQVGDNSVWLRVTRYHFGVHMGKSDSNRTTIPVPLIALFVYTISKQNMPPKKHLRFPTQILLTLLLSIQTTIDQLKRCFYVLHRYQHCFYWSHPIGDSTGLQFFCFVSIDEVETVRVTRVKDSLSNNDWGIRSSNTSALGHTINMGSNCIGRCYGDIFTRQPGKLHFSFPVHFFIFTFHSFDRNNNNANRQQANAICIEYTHFQSGKYSTQTKVSFVCLFVGIFVCFRLLQTAWSRQLQKGK